MCRRRSFLSCLSISLFIIPILLYLNFIDFEKVFARVDRNVIWQLMHHYGIPQKFIKLIQDLFESSSGQVIHNGKLSESFEMSTGVRQGCLLSPMIFIMVVDWIMREVEDQGKTGICRGHPTPTQLVT